MPITVLKIGGSILIDRSAYRTVAGFIHDRIAAGAEKLVVVVSAQYGETDRLLDEARSIVPEPDPAALDLLWSTGEQRSVALLALELHRLGVAAAGLNVHETGLFLPAGERSVLRVELNDLRIRAALSRSDVVVAPGFLARGPSDAIVSLGRGGSDLTAVCLARDLGATGCELLKDVPGYFDRDPNLYADARPIRELTFDAALAMADAGCDLVQREAIAVAQAADLPIVVHSLGDRTRQTTLGSECRMKDAECRTENALALSAASERGAV
ncbi:MAG: hypothetical protein AMXMBFR47_31580 [Planctomycetota bacterium]